MLVLTRKANQQIEIGGNIVVTVLSVKGNSVRLGIEAPRDVRVIRSELPRNVEPTTAEMHDAVELVLPNAGEPEAAHPAKARSASTSLRQVPLHAGRNRELRSSPLLRFIAADAATAVAPEWPTRTTDMSERTKVNV